MQLVEPISVASLPSVLRLSLPTRIVNGFALQITGSSSINAVSFSSACTTEDVLGLSQTLCDAGGPIERLRRKLAAEPQIHANKRTRLVFTADGETSVWRTDRR